MGISSEKNKALIFGSGQVCMGYCSNALSLIVCLGETLGKWVVIKIQILLCRLAESKATGKIVAAVLNRK